MEEGIAPVSPRARRLIARGVVVTLIVITVPVVCDLFFSCGCRAWWAGGTSGCNIHRSGPHCPWCHGPFALQALSFAVVAAMAIAGMKLGDRRGALTSALFGFTGYLFGATIASLITALLSGYPTWLGLAIAGR